MADTIEPEETASAETETPQRRSTDQAPPAEPTDHSEKVFQRVEDIICCKIPVDFLTPTLKPKLWSIFKRLFLNFDRDKLTGLLSAYPLLEKLKEITQDRNETRALFQDNAPKDGLVLDPYTVVFCDINKFKYINDVKGEEKTDQIIRSVANELKKNMRGPTDLLVRYNERRGDEFAMLLEHASQGEKQGEGLAERMKAIIQPLDKIIFKFPDDPGGVIVRMAYGVYELDSDVKTGKDGKPVYDDEFSALHKADERMRKKKDDMANMGEISGIIDSDAEVERLVKEEGYRVVPVDTKEIGPKLWTETLDETYARRFNLDHSFEFEGGKSIA